MVTIYERFTPIDEPFLSIYRFTGFLFGKLLPEMGSDALNILQNAVRDPYGEREDWYEDLSESLKINPFNGTLTMITPILIIFGLVLMLVVLLKAGWNKMTKGNAAKPKENRVQLFLRLFIIFFLFASTLWCEIMYGVALAHLDKMQRSWMVYAGDLRRDAETYQGYMTPNQSDWQLTSNKMTRERIINYFENVNADIVNNCNSSQVSTLPPGIEEMVSSTMKKARKIEELLTTAENSTSLKDISWTRELWMPIQKIIQNMDEFSKDISSFKSSPELKKSPEWMVQKRREKILLNAQAKTLSLLLDFQDKSQQTVEKTQIVVQNLTSLIKNVANLIIDGVQEKVHIRGYDSKYVYYQATVGTVAAMGMFFLALSFFATLYKIVLPDGYYMVNKQERTVGKMLYAGFFFFGLSMIFLGWTLNDISQPATTLRSTCDAVLNPRYLIPEVSPFYDGDFGLFSWANSAKNVPKNGEQFENIPNSYSSAISRMLKRGYRDVFQFDVNPWLIQLKRSADEWKNDQLSETLQDLEFAAYYPFSIKTMKTTKSAMYDLLNQRERRDDDDMKIPKDIKEDLNQLLSDLAYFDFPYTKDDTFKLAENGVEWWNPKTSNYWERATTTINYWDSYSNRYRRKISNEQFNQECKHAVNKYKDNVNNVEARFQTMINIIQKQFSLLNQECGFGMLFRNADTVYCQTIANPTSSLLLFYLINMLLWPIAMVLLLNIARNWDLGNASRIQLASSVDSLVAPLITADKLEEAIHNNPMATI